MKEFVLPFKNHTKIFNEEYNHQKAMDDAMERIKKDNGTKK